jgi:hypothetical protein
MPVQLLGAERATSVLNVTRPHIGCRYLWPQLWSRLVEPNCLS